jgi:hypothetical protein
MKGARARGKVPPNVIRSTEARTELFCHFFMALSVVYVSAEVKKHRGRLIREIIGRTVGC